MRKESINVEIARTHIRTRRKQTIVAALGVTIGLSMYIFSSSLMSGFSKYSKTEMAKTIAHVKVYKEDQISKPLYNYADSEKMVLISNPRTVTESKNINDPYTLLDKIREQEYVTYAAPQVNVDMFYNNGESQLKGIGSGVIIADADAMFNIQSTMLAGNLQAIATNLDAVIIGKGVAEKMNVGLDDNITISSSQGIVKVMKIAGIFTTGNKSIDESKCYIHISTAQQFLKKGSTYITEIYANVIDEDKSIYYANQLQQLTEYKVEGWETTYSDTLSSDKIRSIMGAVIPTVILLVAGFGIYNILNMTIIQKMNDIAILKATGFAGKDIIRIFVMEAVIMGIIGTGLGLGIGAGLIKVLQHVWVGGPSGYFPIYYKLSVFVSAAIMGMVITVGAGFFPALKASRVDPVDIFRK
ncbi:MAG: ABC transporter permease [Chloroflexia bacterium]|nr:ABC transporter permease [Chloroflexia bacterium]